ncbi:L-threonylcarbamoyladenylate synthase [Lactobacillus delbrueckii subsp. bulgaricus]|nr:L-threonylcarbamoyladenylate synthase [Lactobacillus delbrueckii]AQR53574.1 translation factor Sua5 [Lactobacillus delbrueckii subsp. bulgaricus]MBT8807399.1 threonylcarbamoyl-AMP synthase [Lactobacillus delbrueckii subsp. bulgaricus]MBT8810598.1 threonylcarbamoyl-AMP synthase [Lactobacillus delbrueckii subsp. bulgaricus]MBT8817138.1 threonylcarbamoyl-AMP synthase [Lactobacillus delbrueckii subsp. bulgaricus]MBT8828955.1 threonylcarbamoyl-AMP synthase [Lactobacillus delbrueckii subsp. bulga
METKIFKWEQLDEAVSLLREGELVAFPTETVYGLGALATRDDSVKKVYAAKGRPSDNPLIVTVADEAMMRPYAKEVPERAEKLIKHFWPGPLTILLLAKEGALPESVTGGLPTVAFRCPDDQMTHDLIAKLGYPIVGPSANTSTKPSPTTSQHVYHDLKGKIAGIVDGGETEVGLESTIVDLSVNPAVVLRPGKITPEEISQVLGEEVLINRGQVSDKDVPKAPGMKYRHYAPSAQVYVVDQAETFAKLDLDASCGVMATSDLLENLPVPEENKFNLGKNLTEADHNLFAGLRYFDDRPEIKSIYVEGFDQGEESLAYMNRLNKAAGGHHV